MFDRQQLSALAAVVRGGSFENAAGALHVTPSAISQRIKNLEDQFGGILVVRDTPCRLTKAGEKIFNHALQVELLEREVLGSISDSTLPVAVNADSLATWFIPALKNFSGMLDIHTEDEGYTTEWLKNGRVLAAVSATAKPVQGCSIEPLGTLSYIACASPAFAKKYFSKGVTADALNKAPTVAFSEKDLLQLRFMQMHSKKKRDFNPPTYRLPSTHAFVDLALHDLAWGMHPEILVKDHLKTGRLVKLSNKKVDVKLYWQCWRLKSELLQNLTKAVRKTAREYLA